MWLSEIWPLIAIILFLGVIFVGCKFLITVCNLYQSGENTYGVDEENQNTNENYIYEEDKTYNINDQPPPYYLASQH